MEDDPVQQEFSDAVEGLDGHGNSDVDLGGVEAIDNMDAEKLGGTGVDSAVLQS